MRASTKIVISVGAVAIPVLLYAYASGPDPRKTGAPGDSPSACATSGCHVGTPLNGGGGNVSVSFPNGLSYTPGTPQTFTITVTDSSAKIYGFQMTARLESNLSNGQAGDFNPTGQQIVLCDNGRLKPCPASAPVQFIEHNQPYNSNTIQVTWTPPSSNVGNVHIYVAANAANGNGQNTGDHIYTASYTLAPAVACSAAKPVLAAGGVVSAAANVPGLSPGAWIAIYGQNLSSTTRIWGDADFVNGALPTSLDGVSVSIDNKPAFVYFISPGQIDALVPDDANTGPVQVTVTTCGGASDALTVNMATIAPSFFTFDGKYLAATHSNGSLLGKAGLVSGSTPAKAGETVVLYSTGFGPTNPPTPIGKIFSGARPLVTVPKIQIGGLDAQVVFAGVSAAGLYQFNVVIPPGAPPGDLKVLATANSVQTQDNVFLTVSK